MRYPKEFVKKDGRKLVTSGPRDMQRKQQVAYTTSPDVEVIQELKQNIDELKAKFPTQQAKPEGYYTPEEVDEEIRKAVAMAVKETTLSLKKSQQANSQEIEPILQKYKIQILELQRNNDDLVKLQRTVSEKNSDLQIKLDKLEQTSSEAEELRKQIAVLNQALAGKEELVEALKARPIEVRSGTEVIEDPNRPKLDQVFIDPLEKNSGKNLRSSITIEEMAMPDEKERMDDKVNKLKSILGKLPIKKN
jgi:hypothetical protein